MGDDANNMSGGEESTPKFDARLAEGVAYFEQMLEIMPEDRTTLEFLVVAYDQLGQHEKGQKALVNLTKLLISERDLTALSGLIPRLESSDYAPAKALLLKVTTMTAPEPDLTPETPKELTEEEKIALEASRAIEAEIAFGEALLAAGMITEDQASMLKEHLKAFPTDGRIFLISALQILEKENVRLFERVVEWLADNCGTPPIPLRSFEPNKDLFKALPEQLIRLRGVVPFAKLGAVTLVAVTNPMDENLKAAVKSLGACRMYLAEPTAIEAAITKVYGEVVG